MVNAIYTQLTPQAAQYVEKTTMPVPKHTCISCTKLKDGYFCDCFVRPVDKDVNRCFQHSNYSPVLTVFKAAHNIEELAQANERKLYA